MFLHVSVILSTGVVCPIACWDTLHIQLTCSQYSVSFTRGRYPRPRPQDQRQVTPQGPEAGPPWDWRQVPPGQEAVTPPGPETGTLLDQRLVPPKVHCMLGDTCNKQAVCIRLECKLVGVAIWVRMTLSAK